MTANQIVSVTPALPQPVERFPFRPSSAKDHRMRWIAAAIEDLNDDYCEALCDEIESLSQRPQTPETRKHLRHKEHLLDQFTWMTHSDMGIGGKPGAFLGDLFPDGDDS